MQPGARLHQEAARHRFTPACPRMPTDSGPRPCHRRGEHHVLASKNFCPPKIQQTDPTERRQVPEGLWIKCPSCETVLYKADLELNQNVCPHCSHHHRIGARARLNAFLDPEGRYEIGQEVLPVDALKFRTAASTPSA